MHDGDAGGCAAVGWSPCVRVQAYSPPRRPVRARGGNALTVGFSVLQVYVFRAVASILIKHIPSSIFSLTLFQVRAPRPASVRALLCKGYGTVIRPGRSPRRLLSGVGSETRRDIETSARFRSVCRAHGVRAGPRGSAITHAGSRDRSDNLRCSGTRPSRTTTIRAIRKQVTQLPRLHKRTPRYPRPCTTQLLTAAPREPQRTGGQHPHRASACVLGARTWATPAGHDSARAPSCGRAAYPRTRGVPTLLLSHPVDSSFASTNTTVTCCQEAGQSATRTRGGRIGYVHKARCVRP